MNRPALALVALLAGCGTPEAPVAPRAPSQIGAAIAVQQLQPQARGDAFRFVNRAHRMEAVVGADGVAIGAHGAAPSLTLSVDGAGPRPGACAEPRQLDAEGACLRRLEQETPVGTAWWQNTSEGLRHGWDLERGEERLELTVAVDGDLALHDDAVLITAADGTSWRYEGLAAWDADAARLPASLAVGDGEILIEVDARAARWPIVVDPVLTPNSWAEESNQAGALFGTQVFGAGDVDGDGFDDVVVTAPEYDDGNGAVGCAWLMLGFATGPDTTGGTRFDCGSQANADFGAAGAPVGDVNGDGYRDIAIGSPLFDGSGGPNTGQLTVYYGAPGGFTASNKTVIEGGSNGDLLGSSLSGGDLNEDGYSDVIAGAPGNLSSAGRAQVHAGSSAGVQTFLAAQINCSSTAGALCGQSVAYVGDINVDGYGDFVVGAPNEFYTQAGDGMVFVYVGGPTITNLPTPWTVVYSNAFIAGAGFGTTVAAAGDVNGDGAADFLVGAPNATDFGGTVNAAGLAELFLGDTTNTASISSGYSWGGAETNERVGASLAGLGDVNGTGFADVAIGHPGQNGGGGAVYITFGEQLFGTAPQQGITGSQVSAEFGAAVAAAGDVNGDGFADLLVGASQWDNGQIDEGRVFWYSGEPAAPPDYPSVLSLGGASNDQVGSRVAGAGDVNGDGFQDVLVTGYLVDGGGGVDSGAMYVHHGSATGINSTPEFAIDGSASSDRLGRGADGVGDVNGDGYDDVAVGIYNSNAGGAANTGEVQVYYGSATGLTSNVGYSYAPTTPNSNHGWTVSRGGDLNGDGYADFVSMDGAGKDIVWHLGSPTGPTVGGSIPVVAGAGSNYGWYGNIAGGGDVNGDGFDDLVVGDMTAGSGDGAVHLFFGSAGGPSVVPDYSLLGSGGEAMGSAVSISGDINADGRSDILVGAMNNGSGGEGAAYLFTGTAGSNPFGGTPTTWYGTAANGELGNGVALVGDTNGDGYADIALGEPGYTPAGFPQDGRISVYMGGIGGGASMAVWGASTGSVGSLTGTSVAHVGDVNGDGLADIWVGAPGYQAMGNNAAGAGVYYPSNSMDVTTKADGAVLTAVDPGSGNRIGPRSGTSSTSVLLGMNARSAVGPTRVRLEIEVEEQGTAFDGLGTITGMAWTASGAQLSEVVGGLSPGVGYHWRVRVLEHPARNPLMQRGRWFTGGMSGDAAGVHFRGGAADTDGDGVPDTFDCAPTDATVFPNAPELCDGIDNDCDGAIDAGTGIISDSVGVVIPASGTSGVATVTWAGDLPVSDVNVEVNATVGGDLAGLALNLVAPNGTSVALLNQGELYGLSLAGTVFDDEASADITTGSSPYTGSFQPSGAASLSAFDGVAQTGVWQLEVSSSAMEVTIDSWNLTITSAGGVDSDGDGVSSCSDCDDSNAAVYPGAAEVCDNLDTDCDGMLLGNEYDLDADGVPPCLGDCDDADATVFPAAPEICNGQDDNCDALLLATETDDDGDGTMACLGDCDDTDATVGPDGQELCDGVDQDCDGVVDGGTFTVEGSAGSIVTTGTVSFTATVTGDIPIDGISVSMDLTHDDLSDIRLTLIPPMGPSRRLAEWGDLSGTTATSLVFEDSGSALSTGSPPWTQAFAPVQPFASNIGDIPTGTWTLQVEDSDPATGGFVLDWSLTLMTDGSADADADGYTACLDCDETLSYVNPGATEICDGNDNDCDGVFMAPSEVDADGDTWLACADCDDTNSAVYPQLPAYEVCNGIDDNCDGLANAIGGEDDVDGDGSLSCADCDDNDATSFPGNLPEACDGVDNDCDPTTFPAAGGFEVDADGDGIFDCADCDDTDATVSSNSPELCDGLDNDCDGTADAGVPSLAPTTPLPATIPDASSASVPGAVSIDIEVFDELPVTALAVDLSLTHPRTSDLDVMLTAPNGTTYTLVTGAGGANFVNMVFDSASSTSLSGGSPYTGVWAPQQSLAPLVGTSPAGTWQLVVNDTVPGPTGSSPQVTAVVLDLVLDGSADADGDGDPVCSDCDDTDATVSSQVSVDACDGVDNDCDGLVDPGFDNDLDGVSDCGTGGATEDCDDTDPTVYPGASELCDGVDNDCDTVLGADEVDADGDLVSACAGDCDDTDPTIWPGAPELCNGIDDNCSGDATDESSDVDGDGYAACSGGSVLDCDDTSASIYPGATEIPGNGIDEDCDGVDVFGCFEDLDGDGFGSTSTINSTDSDCLDAGESTVDTDCDDTDPLVFLGATEVPNDGIDQDCDGADTVTCFEDLDGDGIGSSVVVEGSGSCTGTGLSMLDGDCDDGDAAIGPFADEVCDGVDNDCDASTNEAFDADGDAFSLCDGDCDDADAARSPGLLEECNGVDDDCDGTTDEMLDGDGDGLSVCDGDCDDGDDDVFPGATEQCNGADDDCDGTLSPTEKDEDGDGFVPCADDCDDGDAAVNPDATEVDCDGLDNDCDGSFGGGEVDLDGDGVTACDGDCEPYEPTAFPGGTEICDGVDNDCDSASLAEELDDDGDGWAECAGDCDDADPAAYPGAPEDPSGPDTNCDGLIGDSDADGDGYSVGDGDCNDDDPDVNPAQAEVCDGADTDCDGSFFPGELQDADADGFIDCADCNALDPAVNPDAEEVCNGIDDDCDGYGVPEGELDIDEDGVIACAGDCNDRNPYVRPGILENCEDGIDNDCDGTVDQDTDNDGDGRFACQTDCDDSDANVHPGIAEVCNGIDDNCDLRVDEGFDLDGDAVSTCAGDCLDTNATVYPAAPEICNDGVDNDCDPETQENIDSDGDGFAPCSEPVGDCWEGNPFVHPDAEETCNFLDDDCNGIADEGLDADFDGWSPCDFDCDDTLAGVNPDMDEVCGNALDDNCDGEIDETDCPDEPLPVEPTDPACACESSFAGGPASALALLLMMGLAARRRRGRHTW